MKKVIILGVEVADVGQEEVLGMVREVITTPRTTPSPSLSPLGTGSWKGGDYHYITTPNPEIVLAARGDKKLRSIINKSFLALPDGFGLKIAAWILGQKLENRIAGADFMLDVCGLAEREGWPVFLLGGMESHRTTPAPPWKRGDSVADHAGERLRKLYPNIQIVGAESGGEIFYKVSLVEFTPSEAQGLETTGEWVASDKSVIDKINQSGAKVLFVGFGCPKQEKWLRDNLNKLTTVKLAMTVGGTFDYLAGRARRAPLALRRSGLEWLWRLVHEPRRLGRIWNATARFMWQVIKWRLRMMFSYRRNVAGFIINKDNQVLIVKRATIPPEYEIEHWQLPQGGAEKDESVEQAIRREMSEEIGVSQLEIIGAHPQKHKYEFPLWAKLRYGFHGQKQTVFYLRWSDKNDAVRLDQEELVAYRWAPITQAVELVHSVRQPMTKMAVEWYLLSLRAPSPFGRRGEVILQSR